MAVIWNQASCVWRFSKIHPGSLKAACPGCYVFCGFGLAHCRQGIVGTVIRLRKRRNRRPKCPSYTHSDRLSWGIQEHDTISLRCTQWEGACYRGLYNCQDLLVWSCRQITGCSLCKVKRRYELRIVSRRFTLRKQKLDLRFDISVENSVSVHVLNSFEQLIYVELDSRLWKVSRSPLYRFI